MSRVDPTAWTLIATGEEGDHVTWLPGYEIIGNARDKLCLLEEIGEELVNWDVLLEELPVLEGPRKTDFPPLYGEGAFEDLGVFLVITDEPIDDSPGRAFNRLEIYLDTDHEVEAVRQFGILNDRLKFITDEI